MKPVSLASDSISAFVLDVKSFFQPVSSLIQEFELFEALYHQILVGRNPVKFGIEATYHAQSALVPRHSRKFT